MRGIHDLVTVRHGQTKGNEAHHAANEKGNTDYFTREFRDRPGHTWELTDLGGEQISASGLWIVRNVLPNLVGEKFTEAFTSPHVRCLQSAARLQIPGQLWNEPEPKLRERDWGDIEAIPSGEYYESAIYALNAIRRRSDYMNWSPPGGESIAQVMESSEMFLNDIANPQNPGSYLISAHGERMTAMRGVIEHVRTGRRLAMLKNRKDQKLDNASVVWHSTRHPGTGERADVLSWYRIANPYNGTDTGWKEIIRKQYTNDELLELAQNSLPVK